MRFKEIHAYALLLAIGAAYPALWGANYLHLAPMSALLLIAAYGLYGRVQGLLEKARPIYILVAMIGSLYCYVVEPSLYGDSYSLVSTVFIEIRRMGGESVSRGDFLSYHGFLGYSVFVWLYARIANAMMFPHLFLIYSYASVLSGMVYFVAVYLFGRKEEKPGMFMLTFFLFPLSLIYYGYVEVYAPIALLWFVSLASWRRILKNENNYIYLYVFATLLAVLLHWNSAALLIPFILWRVNRPWVWAMLGTVAGVAGMALSEVFQLGAFAPLSDLLSAWRWFDILNFFILVYFVPTLFLAFEKNLKNPWLLMVYAGLFLSIVFTALLGHFRDWDVLALYCIPLGFLLYDSLPAERLERYLVIAALHVAMFFFVSTGQTVIERYLLRAQTEERTVKDEIVCSGLENLRKYLARERQHETRAMVDHFILKKMGRGFDHMHSMATFASMMRDGQTSTYVDSLHFHLLTLSPDSLNRTFLFVQDTFKIGDIHSLLWMMHPRGETLLESLYRHYGDEAESWQLLSVAVTGREDWMARLLKKFDLSPGMRKMLTEARAQK